MAKKYLLYRELMLKFPLTRIDRFFLAALILSFCVLAISLSGQLFFGMHPCFLCKLQRIPYLLVFIFSLIGLFSHLKKGCLYVLTSFFALAVLLALLHGLIYFGVVPDFCAQTGIATAQLGKFWAFLIQGVPCSKRVWTFFGIPLYVWSALFSGTFFTWGLCLVRRAR